jgi:hypothetical protein
MGKVYHAIHPGLGRHAAVKVLPASEAGDPEVVSRFINEARAANAIRHPNIVDIYDSGILANGSPYIVMEYLEGETLRQVLDRGALGLNDILDWGSQLAEALAAAHTDGVIHRDLKPDNLFLVPDFRRPGSKQVKVLDFGIAKLERRTLEQVHRTRTGTLLGTPLYMSPEQCLCVKDVDARSDIYALGVILYEMATGQRPFDGDGLFIVISKHISEPPVAPTTHRPDLPALMEAVILQALAKDPAKRQTSMTQLLGQLQRVRGDSSAPGAGAVTVSLGTTPATAVRTFGRNAIMAFLTEIDDQLHQPVVMEIVGGTAALLAHGAQTETKDINSLSPFDQRILGAAPLTTHEIPLVQTTVSAPDWYEERRFKPDLGFRNLVIWVPERHDLMLMKALRSAKHDLQIIDEMHHVEPFDLETIVERYNFGMRQAIRGLGGHLIFDQRIQAILQKLFGGKSVRGSGQLTMR